MSEIYGDKHRALQDDFETRKLADRLEDIIVQHEIGEKEQGFIESRPMFFLSTIDQNGQPTVSYKGGAPGFVKVVDQTTIAFPSYDGNGMYYSVGNLQQTPKVGILFIDFETPHRIRFHGEASASKDDPLMAYFNEAEMVVRVKLSKMWVNCPRYVHKYQLKELSHYVPGQKETTPLAAWKRIDLVQDVLPPKDQGRPEKEGGVITMEEWIDDLQKGEG